MIENIEKEKIIYLKKHLSSCVNVSKKVYTNKQLIISNSSPKKLIGFITYGKASIIKTDINGNTTIMRELKEDDILSNLFFQHSEDEIYIISNNETEVTFIDYYAILKDCNKGCPFHHNLVTIWRIFLSKFVTFLYCYFTIFSFYITIYLIHSG